MSAAITRQSPTHQDWKPVPAARRPVLLVNPRSGGGKAQRLSLTEHAHARGIEVIVIEPGDDVIAIASHAAAGADALGIAGGDGSLAAVAAAAHDAAIPFVCIPAGTRNHFALDLGVDRNDAIGAIDAFVDGVERRIDVGEVNGRMFLNNVSMGVYGDAVQQSGYRDAKIRTMIDTARAVLQPGASAANLTIIDELGQAHVDPAVVLVSNNPYALERPPVAGARPTLTSGALGVVVLDRPGSGHRPPGRAWSAHHLEIAAERAVHGGVDGEAVQLQPPLNFTIRPLALRVRISSRHPGVSPSAPPARARAR
jgi:diacylglycerol kinase family enzyme